MAALKQFNPRDSVLKQILDVLGMLENGILRIDDLENGTRYYMKRGRQKGEFRSSC
ncbi:hypothetical protein B0H17DRAFT_1107605 [Mycena rosella]|uniref:Uncharacterized protein n=1 Tax=Mycena rosella TaxID=1033263 RepID=A0AAD7FN99_MYCRO|nr:hypothetical protein B0H17DRAFT_1107605 [Mycena rosella]